MSKFKVGDKVAIYTGRGRSVGKVRQVISSSNGTWYYDVWDDSTTLCYHEKQLRKIKPKRKAREWTMILHGVGTESPMIGWGFHWERCPVGCKTEVIELREVLKK